MLVGLLMLGLGAVNAREACVHKSYSAVHYSADVLFSLGAFVAGIFLLYAAIKPFQREDTIEATATVQPSPGSIVVWVARVLGVLFGIALLISWIYR